MTPSSPEPLTLQTAMTWAKEMLANAGFDDPEIEARFLLSGLLKTPLTDFYTNPDKAIPPDRCAEFQKMVERRSRNEPVAYILGYHHFMGHDFVVDRRALIPRPETELLVESAIEILKKNKVSNPRILDVGTGSGVIAVTLARLFPASEIDAVDISVDALNLARTNAKSLKEGGKINFYQSDLYKQVGPEKAGYFDMIISNPPYISTSELAQLEVDLTYEPRVALEGGKKGMNIINRLVKGAPHFLRPKGLLIFEIGYQQGVAAQTSCASAGFENIELLKDYQGHDRVVKGEWRGSI